VYAADNSLKRMHERKKTRVAYNLMCDDDWVIYPTSPTTATFGVVCASAVANAAYDCSFGDNRGVANGGSVDTVCGQWIE